MISEVTSDISTDFQAAGCFCLYRDDVLIIQRQRNKAFEFHWAIPSGKINAGESARECMARELFEELGLAVDPRALEELSSFVISHDRVVFTYVAFLLRLEDRPLLYLKRDEVRKCDWVPVQRITKRRVVPYFYNTVRVLLQRLNRASIQPHLLPVPQAKSAKRRSS
jgi:8-oxo-dGTP pyrophosphatase MutT (NUDIX family)